MAQVWALIPQFWVGVLSTLAGAGIIWVVSRQVWPRLRNRFQRNRFQKVPAISGEWESTFQEEGRTKHEVVDVKQVGQKVSGTMILRQEGRASIRSTFRGTIQNRVIKGLYESESAEGFEQGAFVLELNLRANRATGQYIYFYEPDGTNAEITPVKYTWERK